MSEWATKRLGDLIDIKHGYAFKGEYFSEDGPGPLLLTPGNFAIGGGFKDGKSKYYMGPIPRDFRLQPGDLVITMTDLSKAGDTLGYPALIPSGSTYLHNQRIGLVSIKSREVDKLFLFYALRTPEYRGHVLAGATGSTVRHTSPSRVSDFEISIPDLASQHAIANALSALDQKVAVNDAITRGCDELLSLRFTHWMKKNSDIIGQHPLSSLASFVNGRAFTKDASGTGRMVIRIAEINSGPSTSTIYNEIDVSDDHLARPGDVLFSWSGSLGVVRWFRAEGIVNQHIFKVIPNLDIPSWLIFELINTKLSMFRGIAADKATTMGHIQRRHLDEVVAIPAHNEIRRLDVELGPLWDCALSAQQESLKLAELRDTLLPRLMSAEIRVRDAEKVVEEVT